LRGRASGTRVPQRRRGAYRPADNLAAESDEDFEAFFFIRSNPKGLIYERWRHIHGCARFFNAVRDTVTDKFVMTYKAGEPKPKLKEGSR
jgi:sarcosine oxidase subunit delta